MTWLDQPDWTYVHHIYISSAWLFAHVLTYMYMHIQRRLATDPFQVLVLVRHSNDVTSWQRALWFTLPSWRSNCSYLAMRKSSVRVAIDTWGSESQCLMNFIKTSYPRFSRSSIRNSGTALLLFWSGFPQRLPRPKPINIHIKWKLLNWSFHFW